MKSTKRYSTCDVFDLGTNKKKKKETTLYACFLECTEFEKLTLPSKKFHIPQKKEVRSFILSKERKIIIIKRRKFHNLQNILGFFFLIKKIYWVYVR